MRAITESNTFKLALPLTTEDLMDVSVQPQDQLRKRRYVYTVTGARGNSSAHCRGGAEGTMLARWVRKNGNAERLIMVGLG